MRISKDSGNFINKLIVNRKLWAALITIFMFLVLIVLGPLDAFAHGFYYDEPDISLIPSEDIYESINLRDSSYEIHFVPSQAHMAGLEIYCANENAVENGELVIEIKDLAQNVVDIIREDASQIAGDNWYKIYSSYEYKKGQEYILTFALEGCDSDLYLMSVDAAYLPREITSGNVMSTLAYSKSTFTPQEKVLISLFIIAFWILACALLIGADMKYLKKSVLFTVSASIFLTTVLAWNYMYNSMDNQNTSFDAFQVDSETLVSSVIYAEQDSTCIRNNSESGYGLGRYYDLKGEVSWYGQDYITDDNWIKGYSKTEPAIIVNSNLYSQQVVEEGHFVTFANEEVFEITRVEDDGDNIIAYVDANHMLNPWRNGSIDDATFADEEYKSFGRSQLNAYRSQVGMQGIIFRHLARFMDRNQTILNLSLICALLTALTFVLIVMIIAVKYNPLMAGVFYVTFWLSPWVVNFARNLYWVEFTWFLPMMFGIFCSWQLKNRLCRIISYAGAFVAILVKCLCGYEYISVIMMGLIAFLLTDFVVAIIKKDNDTAKLAFRAIIIIGIAAVAGFMAAIFMHAPVKGDGNFVVGLKNIFEQDVLRRTTGGNLNDFDVEYWPSFNASLWETFAQYFHFKTEIILGITGNLFAILCLVPLVIFTYDIYKKRINAQQIAMYVIFFLTTVSWFVLAKGHSYIHTHMSYVLWYFGYIQICFYIIIDRIITAVSHKKIEATK